jgi:hypothetical protein
MESSHGTNNANYMGTFHYLELVLQQLAENSLRQVSGLTCLRLEILLIFRLW